MKVGDDDESDKSSFAEADRVDYASILNPKKYHFSIEKACVNVLNKFQLPAYTLNIKAGSRKGKSDTSFNRNVLGLFIWRHMSGDIWVKTTSLDPEDNSENIKVLLSIIYIVWCIIRNLQYNSSAIAVSLFTIN